MAYASFQARYARPPLRSVHPGLAPQHRWQISPRNHPYAILVDLSIWSNMDQFLAGSGIAFVGIYHRQPYPMQGIVMKNNSIVRTLLITDQTPAILRPGQTAVFYHYRRTHFGVLFFFIRKRPDCLRRTHLPAHIADLLTGSVPKVHVRGPQTLQARMHSPHRTHRDKKAGSGKAPGGLISP